MKALLLMFLLLLAHSLLLRQESFKDEQLQFSRVREAYALKGNQIKQALAAEGISSERVQILILAYKQEKVLELWVKDKASAAYKKHKQYTVCATSGTSGPKRQSGDLQIPEGFYEIDRFNPASSYHLSLGINYPNASDKAISPHPNLGGDIFIHGACVTVGCLPLTDPLMEELYLYAVEARNGGQEKIPVYIFPSYLDDTGYGALQARYRGQQEVLSFWKNLKEGHDRFATTKQELSFSISSNGTYIFSPVQSASLSR